MPRRPQKLYTHTHIYSTTIQGFSRWGQQRTEGCSQGRKSVYSCTSAPCIDCLLWSLHRPLLSRRSRRFSLITSLVRRHLSVSSLSRFRWPNLSDMCPRRASSASKTSSDSRQQVFFLRLCVLFCLLFASMFSRSDCWPCPYIFEPACTFFGCPFLAHSRCRFHPNLP